MTGNEFYKLCQQQAAQSYTGFLSIAKFNRIAPKAIAQAVDEKYRTLSTQKNYDELRNLIATDVTANLIQNSVGLTIGGIPNYLHLLAVKAYFEIPLYLTFTVTNTTPVTIVFPRRNNLRNEKIVIAGVTGTTNANGTRYLKKLNESTFALYADENHQTAIVGNADYLSGGTISRVFFEYAKQITSDRKISMLTQPTPYNPYFEVSNSNLTIHPSGATFVNIDYIKKITAIDPTNTTNDYEQIYPYKLLTFIADKLVTLFGAEERDSELVILTNNDQAQNP